MYMCIYIYIYTHITFFFPLIHQWTLRLLQVLAIVNNAAVNMGVSISF